MSIYKESTYDRVGQDSDGYEGLEQEAATKHTHGPWKVIKSWNDFMVCGPTDEEIIFQDGPYQTPAMRLADANLIAAAPEMIKVLRNVLRHNEALKSMFKLSDALIDDVERAIAKAEGIES